MKKKLILGMTVLFMIIAVVFVACPSDSGGSSVDDEYIDDSDEYPPGTPVINPSSNPDTTLEGDNLELTVIVVVPGVDPETYSYQWYYSESDSYEGGKPIPNATSQTFYPPTEDDNPYELNVVGRTLWYYAVVTIPGIEDPLYSRRQKVTVNPRVAGMIYAKNPTITFNNPDAVYLQGASLVQPLTVTAAVTSDNPAEKGDITYQWYSTDDGEKLNGKPITGAAGTSYIPDVSEVCVTWYYVEVTNTIPSGENVGREKAPVTSELVEINVIAYAQKPDIGILLADGKEGKIYAKNQTANTLSVTASSPDGGELSYQWYEKTSEDAEIVSKVAGAVESDFTPPTTIKGLKFYFCEVTNTLPTIGGIERSDFDITNAVYIGVDMAYLNPTISVKNKVYDGKPDAEIDGTPVLGVQDRVTLVPGTVVFTQTDAGVNIPIRFSGWSLGGDDKDDYFLQMPTHVTATITKAPGAKVAMLTAETNIPIVKSYSISLTNPPALEPPTGQEIEYGVYSSSNCDPVWIVWQDLPIRTHNNTGGVGNVNPISVGTTTLIFARSRGNKNYETGPNFDGGARFTSTLRVTTIAGSQVSKPAVNDEILQSSFRITVKPVSVIDNNGQKPEYNISEKPDGTGFILPQWQEGTTFTNLTAGKGYYVYARSKPDSDWSYADSNRSNLITTVIGSDVGSVIKIDATDDTIIVKSVSLVTQTGQNIEYNISEKSDGTGFVFDPWQEGNPILTGLKGGTTYYAYARSQRNDDYEAGRPSVSSAIATLSSKVSFNTNNTNGGSAIAAIDVPRNQNGTGAKLNKALVTNANAPTSDDDIFESWYEDSARTMPYDFDKAVERSFTLYAGWTSKAKIAEMAVQNMVMIPSGWFTMGSPANEPDRRANETQHRVGLTGFWMCKYEVTQEEWVDIMLTTNPSKNQQGRYVENITWYDAIEFCNKKSVNEGLQPVYTITRYPLSGYPIVHATITTDYTKNGYCLPTEAQWEYACRAETTGATSGASGNIPNAWNLYNMHDSLYEYCIDSYIYDSYYNYQNTNNPQLDPVVEERNVLGIYSYVIIVRGNNRSAFRLGKWYYDNQGNSGDGNTGLRVVRRR